MHVYDKETMCVTVTHVSIEVQLYMLYLLITKSMSMKLSNLIHNDSHTGWQHSTLRC